MSRSRPSSATCTCRWPGWSGWSAATCSRWPACCWSAARLADVYGRRRLFLIGLAVFTLSSLAAGLAGSGGVLIASRAVQGVGAALLMPTTLAIIVATFTDARERNMAIGIWAAVGALALAARPGGRRPDQPARPLGLDLPDQRAGGRDHLRHRGAVRAPNRGPIRRSRRSSTCPAWSPPRWPCSR